MNVRPLRATDIPVLRAMAEASGFPYPDLSVSRETLETVLVLADDEDKPIMAAAADRLVQIYLWSGHFERPLAAKRALRLLHDAMGAKLRDLGYDSGLVFLPQSIAERFGRRLQRSFGWVKTWPCWERRI